MNKIDGGFAFPRAQGDSEFESDRPVQEGMSLRDWFAGQALGHLSPFLLKAMADTKQVPHKVELASLAYEIADAMIAARKEKPGA